MSAVEIKTYCLPEVSDGSSVDLDVMLIERLLTVLKGEISGKNNPPVPSASVAKLARTFVCK